MQNSQSENTKKPYLFILMIIGVVAALCLIVWYLVVSNVVYQPVVVYAQPAGEETDSLANTRTKNVVSDISQLVIPRLDIKADIEAVGTNKKGNMDDPATAHTVAWYNKGPFPGEKGNAVIAGHSNYYGVKGAFSKLHTIKVGDEISVTKDSSEIRFKVVKTRNYPLDNAPLQEIFEQTPQSRITLITCSGKWNKAAKTHTHRFVVFADRVN